jgi:hypothetical protein
MNTMSTSKYAKRGFGSLDKAKALKLHSKGGKVTSSIPGHMSRIAKLPRKNSKKSTVGNMPSEAV